MKRLFLLLTWALLCFSCSKDDEQVNQPTDKATTPTYDGKKCAPLSIKNGDEFHTFHYDSLGNLYYEEYDNFGFNKSNNAYSYIYSNGKLSIIQFRTEWGTLISDFNVEYDSLNRINKVSNGFRTYQISYDISGRILKYSESANNKLEREINYQYNGSQITLTYVYNTSPVQTDYVVYEFDNYPNPITTTPRSLIKDGIFFKNNPIKITYGNSGFVININHTYNSSGYPETGKITFPTGDNKEQTYTYNCQ